MNLQVFQVVYAAILHLCAIVAVTVLLCTHVGDPTAELGALGMLLGIAVGVPVTLGGSGNKPSPPSPPPTT
jgi:hypothetical protein